MSAIKSRDYYISTLAGILAILLWSSNIAFSKRILDSEGIYNGAIYIYCFSGISLFLFMIAFQRESLMAGLRSLPVPLLFKRLIYPFLVELKAYYGDAARVDLLKAVGADDDRALKHLSAIRDDRKQYINLAREKIEELEKFIEEDIHDWSLNRDAGWDVESLKEEFKSP